MVSKAHALSREELIRTLTAYSGITTADGAVDGTTLIDSNLVGRNDFISEKTILILSGDAKDEDKGAASFAPLTGAITLQGTGVSAQIVAGTIFRVLNISTTEVDVAAIAANLGVMAVVATSDDMSDILTTPALAKLRLILNRLSTDAFTATIQGAARTELDTMIGQLATLLGPNGLFSTRINNFPVRTNLMTLLDDWAVLFGVQGAAQFLPRIYGVEASTIEIAFNKLARYWAPNANEFSTRINNGAVRTELMSLLDDWATLFGVQGAAQFLPMIYGTEASTIEIAFNMLARFWTPGAVQFSTRINNFAVRTDLMTLLDDWATLFGVQGASVFNPTIGGSARTTLEAAFAAIGTELAALVGAAGLFHEQADVPLTFNTVNGSETNVLNLVVADTRYIVRSLRLKFADPGGETITVRLYELVNDGLIEVDSFEVTTANFGTYHSLMDMFGMAQLAGDNLKVTTRVSAGGDIATLGQYSHAKTNV